MEHKPNAIEAQATEWMIRRDAGTLSRQEQAELDAWLSADARHRGAFIQAEAHWLALDRWAAHRRANRPAKPMEVAASRTRLALAAGLASIAFAGSLAWYIQRIPSETYSSAIGEVRNIELSDGSRLTLNTDTIATVQFAAARREISLERGEALFKVAHDVQRPFVVHANEVQIKAIGTAFTVRIDATRTDVLVTEGTVEVSRKGPAGNEVRRVSAAQLATLASPGSRPDIEPVQPEAIERKLAWRQGKASFVGEPLSTAAAEINRHSRLQIYVDDPALAGERVIGVFDATDAPAFAAAAAAAFAAEMTRLEDGIHLRPVIRDKAGAP